MMNSFETDSFMASIPVHCPRCNSDHVYRHGKTPAGHVRVKDKIVDMAFNGSGVRDTARVLKIGINTVIRTLKNSPQGK